MYIYNNNYLWNRLEGGNVVNQNIGKNYNETYVYALN